MILPFTPRNGCGTGIAGDTIMPMRVVLDTSVLVAAVRSRRGASFQILTRIGTGEFDVAVSVPLVLEYEDALLRHVAATTLSEDEIRDIVDYICSVATRHEIFYLWRPKLRDPGDDLVLEVAVAANCEAIVTHNVRDFHGAGTFGIKVLEPGEFLKKIGSFR
jgi:putative PIN family toxin of toxin-antitoxin system